LNQGAMCSSMEMSCISADLVAPTGSTESSYLLVATLSRSINKFKF